MVRKAVFSGKFYPSTADEIKSFIEENLSGHNNINVQENLKKLGLILPHAGYVYSAKTAISAIEKAQKLIKPETVILIGTNHTGIGNGVCSVWDSGQWETPFGKVIVDNEIAEELIKSSNLFEKDYSAHIYEHSIEVQLPLLKYFFDDFKIVPIIYNIQNITYTFQIIEIFKKLNFNNLLFVASSDFNHYEDDKTTRLKDQILIEKILERDIKGMYEVANEFNITACGLGPMSILVGLFNNIELVDHTTSAEFSNDYSLTVGYASFLLR